MGGPKAGAASFKAQVVESATINLVQRNIAVTKVEGPDKINPCCGDPVFEASEFSGSPTEDEKLTLCWRVRTEGGTALGWMVALEPVTVLGVKLGQSKAATTPAPSPMKSKVSLKRILFNPHALHGMADGTKIEIYAYFKHSDADGAKAAVTIEQGAEDEICWFVTKIREVEKLKPGWDGEDTLNALRKLSATDSKLFRWMYGRLIASYWSDAWGSNEIGDKGIEDYFKKHTEHKHDGAHKELGVVKDCLGDAVAMAHVFSGMSAGPHRDESVTAAEGVDNLYAVTISGDLGQSAVMLHHRAKMKKGPVITRYVGGSADDTEATDAELIGDIDGFLLGLTYKDFTDKKISDVLAHYYCDPAREEPGMSRFHFRKRYSTFNAKVDWDELPDQVERFIRAYGSHNGYLLPSPMPPVPPDRFARDEDRRRYRKAQQEFEKHLAEHDAEQAQIPQMAKTAVAEFKAWLEARIDKER